MINAQRSVALFDLRDGAERHAAAVAAVQANRVEAGETGGLRVVLLQHHAILIGLSVNR